MVTGRGGHLDRDDEVSSRVDGPEIKGGVYTSEFRRPKIPVRSRRVPRNEREGMTVEAGHYGQYLGRDCQHNHCIIDMLELGKKGGPRATLEHAASDLHHSQLDGLGLAMLFKLLPARCLESRRSAASGRCRGWHNPCLGIRVQWWRRGITEVVNVCSNGLIFVRVRRASAVDAVNLNRNSLRRPGAFRVETSDRARSPCLDP